MPHQRNILIELASSLAETFGIQALRRYLKYGSWDIFSMVFIETITACNRRCVYCPNSRFDRGLIQEMKKMETRLFHKIIDELAALAPAGWAGDIQPHFYGEPLLDERMPEFVRYIRGKLPASPISLFTNGDFLTIELYDELVNSGVTRFVITQHSAEESAALRGVLEHHKIRKPENVTMEYRKLEVVSSRGGIIDVVDGVRLEKCTWPPTTVGIGYDGNILFCCNDYFGTVALGNMKNERLLDVWRKPYYRNLRKDLRRGIFTHELCKKCSEGLPRN